MKQRYKFTDGVELIGSMRDRVATVADSDFPPHKDTVDGFMYLVYGLHDSVLAKCAGDILGIGSAITDDGTEVDIFDKKEAIFGTMSCWDAVRALPRTARFQIAGALVAILIERQTTGAR